jgi:hypothetical protein
VIQPSPTDSGPPAPPPGLDVSSDRRDGWLSRRWILIVIAGLAVLLLLRACLPGLRGPSLPADVVRKIVESHTVCIGTDQVPIWPGEPRQAQCGQVSVEVLAAGTIPAQEDALGITKAVCYRLTVENPYWETLGQTRHEILTHAWTSNKVAILQDGTWVTFSDEDQGDRSRWSLYACPTDER